ncbi:hypothetical protein [Blastococcus sp. URHD0036]|uniref:hypothetical protein n=1 Tax=Blastococcus sp. URHD0036 TaxID=1380356 RepID=UPI000497ABC8|nr:hypothetical protein [Blastococcus sp. URHD0036]
MFKEPLRRDPLVVGWALCLLLGATIALSGNTEWRGRLEADRVQTFLGEMFLVLVWSVCVLFFLAYVRAHWHELVPRHPKRKDDGRESALPWTDRWISDGRQAEAERRAPSTVESPLPAEAPVVVCRHGVRAGAETPVGQPPVLRALSVSHHIVQPGSAVSVTWCFEHADDVVVDGLRGYPACGEAPVRIRSTRSVEVIGRNRTVEAPASTSTVVATAVPPLQPPRDTPAPSVALRVDVAATVGAGAPVAARLDALYQAADRRRRSAAVLPGGLVGLPSTLRGRLGEISR